MRYIPLVAALALPALLAACEPVAITAGVGTAAMMAADRRSSGNFIDDQTIELKAGNRIGEKLGDSAHVNVTSYNRVVLLTGEVSGADAKEEAEKLARSVDGVRNTVNDLVVGPPSSFGTRSNDSYVTSKVKARFLDGKKIGPHQVKVVTESGTVYLLGLVKRSEGDEATEIARTTGGVKKVVKVFEYLD